MIDLKRITLPVFLIYAGAIHAIGLALLLPLIVTLPGPGSMITPTGAPNAVEPDAAEADQDQTSALSPPSPVPVAPAPQGEAKPDAPRILANANPTAQPEKSLVAAPQARDKAKSGIAVPKAAKKPIAQRSSKPTLRRSAKKDTKIAPFAGGMSGLFTPGAPSKHR